MTDNNFVTNNMQLYQELRKRFPNAAHYMLMETIEKHGNNLQRCIEDLSLISPGQYNPTSQAHNLNFQRYPFPTGANNRRPAPPPPGTRSRSVSGAPPGTPAGLGFPNVNQAQRQLPQSAPVITGPCSPFSAVRFSYSNNSSSENLTAIPRDKPALNYTSSAFNSQFTSPATNSAPKAPKPPVPPPTYRSHLEQQHMNSLSYNQFASNNTREQYHSLYPSLSNDLYSECSPSSPSQPRKHKTSLTMIPSSPQMMDSYRQDYNCCAPPYGWNPNVGTHSTSVNLQLGPPSSNRHAGHQEVQITTSGNMNYGGGLLVPVGSAPTRLGPPSPSVSPQPQQASSPCHSRLHISISPNGGSISAMRSQINPHSPLPGARFQLQIPTEGKSPVNVTFSPSSASSPIGRPCTSQVSPRISPQILEEGFSGPRSLFDEDDPEQMMVKHSPLKPVPSPGKSETPTWNVESDWTLVSQTPDGLVHQNEVCSGDAYSQALLTHQKQKFGTLQRELERDKAQLELYRRDVTSKEQVSFQQHICQDQMFFTFEDLQNLRAEIRSLMVDCQCMTRLVDLLHKGQVPLGETNEEFYKTINTGQQVPVLQIGELRPPVLSTFRPRDHSRPSHPLPQQLTPPPLSTAHPPSITKPAPPPPQDEDEEEQTWECCACTFHNNPAMVMCEMCEMPKFVQESLAKYPMQRVLREHALQRSIALWEGEETHNFRIHVQQNSSCAAANKALQLKLTHRQGAVRR